MNLAQVQADLTNEPREDLSPKYRAEEARLLKIIEALQGVEQSKEWSTLKTEVFDTLVNSLEKDLRTEARKETPDPNKLNRLTGELIWAERYSDLGKLGNRYREQLQAVRIKLNVKSD